MPPWGLDEIAAPIALLIAVIWAIVAIGAVVTDRYTALSIVTPVVLVVAGALFGFHLNGKHQKP